MATLSGTARSAAPVRARSVRAATCVGLLGDHVHQDLVVDLEHEIGGETPLLEPGVESDQGQFEQVGGQPLDARVHRLALCRLAHLVVAGGQIGQGPAPSECRHRVAREARLGHRPLHVGAHRREPLEEACRISWASSTGTARRWESP